jgi:hypothetical protein
MKGGAAMFIYRGTKRVGKGVYWDPERKRKVILEREDMLPGPMDALYYRLPHSYLLLGLLAIGLVFSVALPYGAGTLLFFGLLGACWIVWRTTLNGYAFFKELFAESTFFGYTPLARFFTGRKRKMNKGRKWNEKH